MPEFLDSNEIKHDGAALKARMDQDGYLFFRELLPKEVLEPVRLTWLAIAQEAGWVKSETPIKEAIADLNGFCVEPQAPYMAIMYKVYTHPAFHAIQQHPHIMDLLKRMLNDDILAHPRIIGRTIFPQRTEYTTPAHQDWIPIQGTAGTYTAWIGMADVPRKMGGLTLNAGSHLGGLYDFKPALGAGGTEITDPLDETKWVYSPIQQGDVLFFHSMMVHKGMSNTSDRLRLSIDARYQRVSDPISASSLDPHGNITWEAIYPTWRADHPLKYYWRPWNMTINAYDSQYVQKRDDMALEMGEAGDPNARAVLERILARGDDPEKRARARTMLEKLDG